MADWITVPNFVNNQIVQAETFQDVWTNLETLKNPTFVINQTVGDASTTTTFTSTSFADIDATNYQLAFNTNGGDVLLVANIRNRHSASNGRGFYRLLLDGVTAGNLGGLALWHANGVQSLGETFCFTYVWENVSAGSHTATVQVATSGATLNVDMYPNTSFWVLEF